MTACVRCERPLPGTSYWFGGKGPLCAKCLVDVESGTSYKPDRPWWKWLGGLCDAVRMMFRGSH